MSRRFVRVPKVWNAVVDTSRPEPAAWFAGLVASSLRYRLPARRRFGAARAAVVRRGIPEGPLATVIRRLPRTDRPDLDALAHSIPHEWLPAGVTAGDLAFVELARAAARTVFVFATGPDPALVVKYPRADSEKAHREAEALTAIGELTIAPRFLGPLDGALVQTGLAGRSLEIEVVTVDRAPGLQWTAADAEVGRAVGKLCAHTARPVAPASLDRLVAVAAEHPGLPEPCRRAVAAAGKDLRRAHRAVRRHGDVAPQNCLLAGERFSGLVDWENTRDDGAPGFDVWNFAVSKLENGIGLARWSPDVVRDAFGAAWVHSSFMAGARSAAREAAEAAGVAADCHDALEIAFFARRLALRIEHPDRYIIDIPTAAAMLATACAS